MRTITKVLGVGAVAAVAGAIGWHALADTPFHGGPGFGPMGMHGMGPGMMGHGPMQGAFGNPATHLASLKTELGITPAQEQAWDTYAKTVEDTATPMRAQHQGFDMTKIHSMSPQDRQTFITQQQEQHQKAFETVKGAAEKLLTALDDTQKTKAKEILPGLRTPGPGVMPHAAFGGPTSQPGQTGQ